MKKIFIRIINAICVAFQVIKSLCAILVFSQISGRKNIRTSDNTICNVLGNGPSLAENINIIKDAPYPSIAVNFLCKSEYFRIIKPSYYLFIDSSFLNGADEKCANMRVDFCNCVRNIDWQMTLFLPFHQRKSIGAEMISKINNDFLKIKYINTTPIDGPIGFRNFLYKSNLGMPLAYNVINAALMVGINLGFKELHLFGAEHSFLQQLCFDEEGNLCGYNSHVYKDEFQKYYKIPRGGLEDGLYSFAKCLTSYRYISDYAKYCNTKIFNRCKDSFIESFDKKFSY